VSIIKKSAALVGLGCDKNRVDGEKILGSLYEHGYTIYDSHEIFKNSSRQKIDLLVINTCAFIGAARDEAIQAITEAVDFKRLGKIKLIAVSGCFGIVLNEYCPAELKKEIDFFIGAGDIGQAYEIVEGIKKNQFRPPADSLKNTPRLLLGNPHYAFLKVAEGCDRRCSFCTIPSLRGKYVSRSIKSILDETKILLSKGIKEIIIVSQDTSSFGKDRGKRLSDLIDALDKLRNNSSKFWVRLHYLYPSKVTNELIEAIAGSDCVAPYFDIPIQHAHPDVLRLMRRPSNHIELQKLFERIRARFREVSLRTTIITGHPGENKKQFDFLLSFLESVQFDRLGVIPYSPEPGTFSATLSASNKADERAKKVMELQREISKKRLEMRIGKKYSILMDSEKFGRTEFESPEIDGVVEVEGKRGNFVSAVIESVTEHDMKASIV